MKHVKWTSIIMALDAQWLLAGPDTSACWAPQLLVQIFPSYTPAAPCPCYELRWKVCGRGSARCFRVTPMKSSN
ncbi:hypothetical protein AK812_SmicGene37727 [Symbiodinium microadriaticum]|uniref:Secreted protein n=1 Tax=Symbiodinium microadriaticum TaxID=2951 RepID=A0A1Q9CFP6_SYMMI|nr:hypothetical protein AK812_SmicGene37727 [Symbiodinium microadriaticum]